MDREILIDVAINAGVAAVAIVTAVFVLRYAKVTKHDGRRPRNAFEGHRPAGRRAGRNPVRGVSPIGDTAVVRGSSISAGVALALASAFAFGCTIPVVHRFGSGVGALTTACLLYAGAALMALARPTLGNAEARVQARHWPRIALVAFAGAVIAPTALAWGLQRTDAASASLFLNFEAVFTVLLARVCFGEHVGARVAVAVAVMVIGGGLLVGFGFHAGSVGVAGLVAVGIAALGWAFDNTLTRPLADLDPVSVIVRKAALGATFTAILAVLAHEPVPRLSNALVLLACGATGYGLSLRLYLLAQRRIGAARTGSMFATAPFLGAALAWAIGDSHLSSISLASVGMFGIAVYLHMTEKHGHVHTHDGIEHEHAHRHDDGHHDHDHENYSAISGEHSHVHKHNARMHAHEHAPDIHHAHRH